MTLRPLPLMILATLSASPAFAAPPTIADAAPVERRVITSADQMPRRQYTIPKLPSELILAPQAEVQPLLDAVDRDLATDLATLDIQDRAARTSLINARAQIALQRGDFNAARAFVREVRAQQEKAADKLTSGVLTEAIAQARAAGGSEAEQRAKLKALLAETYGAMPWDVVGDNIKGGKSSLELLSRDVAIGGVKTAMDPMAKNLSMNVPAGIVIAVASIRNNIALVLPARDDIVAVMQALVDRNQVAKVDRWSERLVALPADAPGKPVVVGIWDSGTDVALFKPAAQRGIAFDAMMNPATPLVRPMGEAEPRLPDLKRYVKGSMDLKAALDTPEARALKQRITTLRQDEVKQFSEDLGAVGMWVHGTHVAGIAVEGNPFAQVTAVAMHWSHKAEPVLVDEAYVKRGAAAYRAAVAHFRKAGARVVNMSWRYGPSAYESSLAYHNVGGSPEERKQLASKLFAVEKQALEEAIAGAPEILFVAGSGNEDNSADFSQYIPAGFTLPNLITVGAVDQSGTETNFSTFGRTVVVHANGFEVTSFMPGGEKTKLSGTSMASPQVANLAAKLFAMRPELTPVQVKELILQGAQKNGRVNLIDPRRTLALAGVKA